MATDSWKTTLVNIDGEFVPGPDATISVLDRSFVYGDGVFEGIGVFDNKIVLLDEHLDRLYKSAERTGIEIPVPNRELRQRIVETARENDMRDGYLRPLVSRGSGPLGIHNTEAIDEPTIVVIPQVDRAPSFDTLAPETVRISAVRQPSPDTLDPRIKSNNYLPNIMAVNELAGTDDDTAVLLDRNGNLTEAAAANIFVVEDDHVRTPPEGSILVGTTRNAVLEVAADEGLEVSVETLTPYDLYTADEAFLTGSLSGVSPVVRVNDAAIGDATVGSVTTQLATALKEYLVKSGTPVA